MKQITITLPDTEAGKFVASLLNMNVTFTVATTVARDPVVFAAAEAIEGPKEAPVPGIGPRQYVRKGRHVQRLTLDGRSAMEVVESKIKQFAGRRFSLFEIKDLAKFSGFQRDTMQNQLHILIARGRLVKLSKNTYQEVPREEANRPLAEGGASQEPALAASQEEPAELVSGQGWRSPQ